MRQSKSEGVAFEQWLFVCRNNGQGHMGRGHDKRRAIHDLGTGHGSISPRISRKNPRAAYPLAFSGFHITEKATHFQFCGTGIIFSFRKKFSSSKPRARAQQALSIVGFPIPPVSLLTITLLPR